MTEEKIVFVEKNKVNWINGHFEDGWTMVHMIPVEQKEAIPGYGSDYGLYVYLRRENSEESGLAKSEE